MTRPTLLTAEPPALLTSWPARVARGRRRARLIGLLAAGGLVVATLATSASGVSVAPAGVLGHLALGAALLFGLPHGAADVVAPVLTSRGRAFWSAGIIGYAGVATAVYILWMLSPAPALIALLGLAVLHFGEAGIAHTPSRSSGGYRMATTMTLGGIPVVVPLAVHAAQLRRIVSALSAGDADVVTIAADCFLVVVSVAAVATVLAAVRRREWISAIEPILLATMFVAVSPLVAFGVYYALWHSLRQGFEAVTEVAARRSLAARCASFTVLSQSAVPTCITIALGAVLATTRGLPALDAALIGVLCLTVPHTICAALTQRSARSMARRAEHTGVERSEVIRQLADPMGTYNYNGNAQR